MDQGTIYKEKDSLTSAEHHIDGGHGDVLYFTV